MTDVMWPGFWIALGVWAVLAVGTVLLVRNGAGQHMATPTEPLNLPRRRMIVDPADIPVGLVWCAQCTDTYPDREAGFHAYLHREGRV
jgi:hypothetical protein